MAIARFYVPNTAFELGQTVLLPAKARHHAGRVLRMVAGEKACVFNGKGEAAIGPIAFEGTEATVRVETLETSQTESPIAITLLQALVATEKLDWVIEKAVELGVSHLILVPAKRSVTKLADERREKRLSHCEDIAIAACEQCGRNTVPTLDFLSLEQALKTIQADRRYILALSSKTPPRLTQLTSVAFAIGPEGGFCEEEIALAQNYGWETVLIGPRVLRTETAGIVAATLANAASGDMRFS